MVHARNLWPIGAARGCIERQDLRTNMTDPESNRFTEAFDNFVIGKSSLTFNGMARTTIVILVFIIVFGLIFYAVK
jgi:hypothetical protein